MSTNVLPSPDPRVLQFADRLDRRVALMVGSLALAAEAVGDFPSLDAVGRRELHVRLATPDARLIARRCETLLACLK